ncbi:MAG: hypothetical protein QM765_26785 [Myxococcales bacterium]
MKTLLSCLVVALATPVVAQAAELLAPVPLPVVAPPAPAAAVAPAPAATPAPSLSPAAASASRPAASGGKLSDDDAAAVEDVPKVGTRHFGILYGAGPGVLALDLEIDHFYGFVSAPLPLVLFTNADLAMGALALGATFALPRDPRWSFDVWAFGVPAHNTGLGWDKPQLMVTFGVGAGFHFTSQKGFTVALKVPLLGSTVSLDGKDFYDAGARAASFYENAVLALPVAAFGYRF